MAVTALTFADTIKADDGSVPLQGEAFIAGASPVDPPTDEPQDTHVYLTLTGEAARKLFDSLKSPQAEDACRGEGWMVKSASDVNCVLNLNSGEAECDFSIDLRSGSLDAGRPC